MPGRSSTVVCLAGTWLVLGCDRAPKIEARAAVPVTAAVMVTTAPDREIPVAAPAAAPAAVDRQIAGPSEEGTFTGMETPEDPLLTLFDPAAPRVVTLALVVPAARRRVAPSMDLFGGADQPWRVQVGPRTDLGRKSGLMLRGGTEGQHNRWDINASATVGERSNVQGIVRYHP